MTAIDPSALKDSVTEVDDSSYLVLGQTIGQAAERATSNNPRMPLYVRLSFEPESKRRFLTQGPLKRGPLGVLAPSLLTYLGFEDDFIEVVLSLLEPYCNACSTKVQPPRGLDFYQDISTGYLALVPDQDAADISLKEWCDLLGVERAVVNGLLVRIADEDVQTGKPVLRIAASGDKDELRQATAAWFGGGGGPLILFHFTDRNAQGEPLGVVSDRWSCKECGRTFGSATRLALTLLDPCSRCRGEGWLAPDGDRLCTCPDCDGFGALDELCQYRLGDIPLKHIAMLTIRECLKCFAGIATSETELLVRQLTIAAQSGFAEYPLGTPVSSFSEGEKVLLTLLTLKNSELRDVTPLIDLPAHGLSGSLVTNLLEMYPDVRGYLCADSLAATQHVSSSAKNCSQHLRILELERGPLRLPEFRIPLGQLSYITGPAGSGKSVLVHEIAARFAKRRKLAHLCDFGTLKSCSIVQLERSAGTSVLELLQLNEEIARLLAKSPDGMRAGYTAKEILGGLTSCITCGVLRCCGACEECRSAPPVATLRYGDTPLTELLSTLLTAIPNTLLGSDLAVEMEGLFLDVGNLADNLPVSLGSRAEELSPALCRYLSFRTQLIFLTERLGRELNRSLVLLDGPFGLTSRHLQTLLDHCLTLVGQGATVVWCDMEPRLESVLPPMVTLVPAAGSVQERCQSNYFDRRFCRYSDVRYSLGENRK